MMTYTEMIEMERHPEETRIMAEIEESEGFNAFLARL